MTQLVTLALCVTWAAPAPGAVLCEKRSGVVVVRTACKKKEKPLDLTQFGVVGPKGDSGPPGQTGEPGPPGVGPLTTCPTDSVLVGTACVDKYEASVWQIPPSDTALVAKVQQGEATLADLTGGGAVQLGCVFHGHADYPATFPATGNWTDPVYAVSVAGVLPSACITWFQAEQACALARKRLVTNQEWQRAAAGTPDSGIDDGSTLCKTGPPFPTTNTGSRSACVSKWGAFDMVGNAYEWVADWGDLNTNGCSSWPAGFGGDTTCLGGDGVSNFPGALIRGGVYDDGANAGVFAARVGDPSDPPGVIGFRCAR